MGLGFWAKQRSVYISFLLAHDQVFLCEDSSNSASIWQVFIQHCKPLESCCPSLHIMGSFGFSCRLQTSTDTWLSHAENSRVYDDVCYIEKVRGAAAVVWTFSLKTRRTILWVTSYTVFRDCSTVSGTYHKTKEGALAVALATTSRWVKLLFIVVNYSWTISDRTVFGRTSLVDYFRPANRG